MSHRFLILVLFFFLSHISFVLFCFVSFRFFLTPRSSFLSFLHFVSFLSFLSFFRFISFVLFLSYYFFRFVSFFRFIPFFLCFFIFSVFLYYCLYAFRFIFFFVSVFLWILSPTLSLSLNIYVPPNLSTDCFFLIIHQSY